MGISWKEFFIGAATIALSFALPGSGAAISALRSGLFSVGLMFGGRALADRDIEQQSQGALVQSLSTTNNIPIVYGTARVAGKIVWADTWGLVGDVPNERLDMVCCLCLGNRVPQADEAADPTNGEIMGFGAMFLGDEKVLDADAPTSTDGWISAFYDPVADATAKTSYVGWSVLQLFDNAADNFHRFNRHFGAHDQVADTYMAAINGASPPSQRNSTTRWPWTEDHELRGIAYTVPRLYMDDGGVFPPGSGPPNVTAVMGGRRLYDPRDDTWTADGGRNDNWALCVRDYMLDERSGCALTLDLLDETSFMDMADVSEEVVIIEDGPDQRRFTCNGVVDTSQSTLRNLQQLLATGNGFLTWEGGQFRIKRMDDANPLADLELNEHNIIGDWELMSDGPEEWTNLVIANYVNGSDYDADTPDDHVAQVQYPPESGISSALDDDGGFFMPREVDFPFVNNEGQAYSNALELYTRARNTLSVALTAKEEALTYSLFDRVRLTHQTFNLQRKVFYVLGMGLHPNETVRLALREADQEGLIPPPGDIPPPNILRTELDGTPLENVYADGHVWIGIILNGGAGPVHTRIFDVVTEQETALSDGADDSFGFGYAYDPVRKEMWMLGTEPSEPTLRVYSTLTLAFKRSYSYTGYTVTHPHALGYCAGTGTIFASFRTTSGTAALRVNAVQIHPDTGAIIAEYRPGIDSDDTCDQNITDFVRYFVWHPIEELMYAGLLRDQLFTIDPVTHATSNATGAVGGLVDTGGFETEIDYMHGYWYLVYDRRKDIYRNPTLQSGDSNPCLGSGLAVWKNFGSPTQQAPAPVAICPIPSLRMIAVSRGWSGNLSSDPTERGQVTLYDEWGNAVKQFSVNFEPARISYAPDTNSLWVVSAWYQDTQWFRQTLSLAGVASVPYPPADDPTGPERPPDQPIDPTVPAPGPPEQGDPSESNPADAPTIVTIEYPCSDGLTESPAGFWDGTIQTGLTVNYTDSPSHPGAPVQIGVWAWDGDPALDPPLVPPANTTVIDADSVRLWCITQVHVDTPTANKPACPTYARDIDQIVRVRIRHDLGAGSFGSWSAYMWTRVRNPQTVIDPQLPPPPTDTSTVGAPNWYGAGAQSRCVVFDDPATGQLERVEVNVYLEAYAFQTATGVAFCPYEFAEFDIGDDPDVATPLRIHIVPAAASQAHQWMVWRVVDPNASCAGPSTTPDVARTYYVRHVLDAIGGRGPWSSGRTIIFQHPGP